MHCRHHAAQLRGSYEAIRAAGAELVALGTGDVRYAKAFIADEEIPFPVLLDEDGQAADAAKVKKGNAAQLLGPRALRSGLRAWQRGHRQKIKTGRRPTQLGATFVIGPGDVVRFEHLDDHVGDHASIEDVLAVVRASQ
jgi:peroxiredoxin